MVETQTTTGHMNLKVAATEDPRRKDEVTLGPVDLYSAEVLLSLLYVPLLIHMQFASGPSCIWLHLLHMSLHHNKPQLHHHEVPFVYRIHSLKPNGLHSPIFPNFKWTPNSPWDQCERFAVIVVKWLSRGKAAITTHHVLIFVLVLEHPNHAEAQVFQLHQGSECGTCLTPGWSTHTSQTNWTLGLKSHGMVRIVDCYCILKVPRTFGKKSSLSYSSLVIALGWTCRRGEELIYSFVYCYPNLAAPWAAL